MLRYAPLLLLLIACAHDIRKLCVPGLVPDALQTEIQLPSQKGKSLQLLYLGCGHMIIGQDGEAFLTDPFFSVQPPRKMVGKVQTKKEYHERWQQHIKKTIGFESVQTGLVSHSHYDHLMDLPVMLTDHDFPHLKTVYGNAYLPKMLTNFQNRGVTLSHSRKMKYLIRVKTHPTPNINGCRSPRTANFFLYKPIMRHTRQASFL